ncbi:PREDICTED: uncharacterized protein LOC106752351 [Dinoponera quadriceps]|uniref:Histone-lysine N-methyltransferase trithorax n=1 Tax=Dinoponera quadriceps TaxID=609295 RepID=A0A6P3YG57_DINQU|nr:PREDICTED: uncharacterized protein LOC106752351 [Dinoponera quadriceps]
MGRSKFPGKPPKTATRKRIKVLGQPEVAQNDPVTVAENIYYGLSLFNETFGDNEKEHPPFHGFSTKEANLSASYIRTQQHNAEESGNKSPSVTVENPAPQSTKKDTTDNARNSPSDPENGTEKLKDGNSKPVEDTGDPAAAIDDEASPKNQKTKSRRNCKNIKFSNYMKSPVLKSVNNILDQHQRTRQLRNSTAKRLLQRAKSGGSNTRNLVVQTGEKASTVRKFVLPVRSVHSSRVIKPNKRFIEELEEVSGTEHSENEISVHVKKAKLNSEKHCNQESKLKGDEGGRCTKMRDKETRSKPKKVLQSVVDSGVEVATQPTTRGTDKSTGSVQNAQISKVAHREVKKSHTVSCKNKVSNENASDNNSGGNECPPNPSRAAQNAKSTVPRNQKQISIPTKVLPESNVPNFESSRVQTRSGTQSEVAADASNQASSESGAGLTEGAGCARTDVQPDNDKTAVSTLESFEARESNLSESESEHSNHTEDEQSEFSGMKLNGGKVILRKARLKLDNKCLTGTEGPFSTTSTSNTMGGNTNLGLTGTIKCGVCGAVRFYRFVKQARKFGIHSCESCRKFISKMIKRQACAKSSNKVLPVLQCHKGDGLCLVPPVVRSQQWNLMRCVYKARCPACWLKMCLKCYNIPSALRTGLNALLPPIMRDPLSISLPLGQDEDGQGQKLGSKLSWPAEDSSERNLFKSATSWRNFEMGQKTSYQGTGGFLYTKIDKFDTSLSISPNKKRRKNNRIKVRKKIKNPVLASSGTGNQCPPPLRQRLELKGPRVKHVCRSASVALGQPIATFPAADTKEDNEHGKNIPKTAKETEKPEKRDEVAKEKEAPKNVEDSSLNLNVNTIQQSHPRRSKPQQSVSTSHFPVISKAVTDTLYTVSIDFWEQYDPSEVGAKGFALIGSELFHIPAICYLCGSAGKEPLIHCQCCCEPYHAFCLEPSEWNACAQPNWCCPRCTICQSCHLRSGPKLSCIRCRQSFHHSCLSKSGVSSRLYSPDRPYVCQSCIKCKSCGSEGVNVHVGNLPLCSMCFKLRQQGNYCPLCQRCYNENDFDTKMMECSECSCWVHARCEGLSDERYQVLSYLPDSIEFTCSQCSSNSNSSIWRNAIEAELKAGFISVIKALSKNRRVCTALKWSPRKECLCRPLLSVRKLEFPEDKAGETRENEDPEESNGESKSAENGGEAAAGCKDAASKTEPEEQSTEGPARKGLRRLRQKFHLRECSVRVKNCIPKDAQDAAQERRENWTSQESATGDATECHCSEQQIIARPSPTLMSVKRRVNGNEYKSLSQFHCDMEHVISRSGAKGLTETYHDILQEVFPWFSPKSFKSSDEEECEASPSVRNTSKDAALTTKFDDPILEAWKEELMKAPKAIAAKTANLYSIHAEDSRSCCLCKGLGDGQETKEGRLLYCGQNEWVHANCALWSNEVFEEIDGSLQNVHSAISRGRLIRCTECGKKGASVGCCAKNCSNTFHYPCARNVGLDFNDDKTVFCAAHANHCGHKPLQSENEFSLKRSVYVELDRKKKKQAEPNKVKVMIGSLTIDCLGTVVPEFSDTAERIVPCDYKCSRLYWSTVNPYKIVRYCIRTYVQVHMPDVPSDMENNVTIDHTKELEKVEAPADAQKAFEYLAVKQTLDTLIDIVCNKEVDENLAEQNNTDILPPELKEAIFEDLPHDLLDGISMQDIFPKMSYEDFLAMDLKNDGTFTADLFKDDMLPTEVEETAIKPPDSKISKVDSSSLLELGAHNDLWVRLEAKSAVHDLMDDLFNSKSQKRGGRELKRSKSEVMSNNPLIVGGHQRHHQRSCSLTWSCKLDNSYGAGIKRRKLPRNPSGTVKPNEAGLIVLDAQNDRASMFHELRIPESIMVTVGRGNTSNILTDSMREFKYCIEDNRRILPARDDAKEHKRLFWHPRQQQPPRILQVDGPADASECSSPEYNAEEKSGRESIIPQLDGIDDEHSSSDTNEPATFLQPKRIFSFVKSPRAKSGSLVGAAARCCCKTAAGPPPPFKEKSVFKQIPQLDGADDISSDDECQHAAATFEQQQRHIDRPVTCKRCCCTYRTQDSYNRHLASCDIMITSDSDSETMDNKLASSPDSRFSPSNGSVSPQFITLSPSEGHTLSTDYTDIQATSPIEASVPSPHPSIQIEPIAQAIITPQIHAHATHVETVHQTVLASNEVIVQTQYTRRTTTLPNPVLPQESTVRITEITDGDTPRANAVVNTPMSSPDSTVPTPEMSPTTFSSTGVQTAHDSSFASPSQVNRGSKSSKAGGGPRLAKPRAKTVKSQLAKNVGPPSHARYHQPVQSGGAPVIQLAQQTQQRPTVILQQVASPGIVSAYVETLQQQSGQNLQYITTIGGQHESGFKPQFIATNHLVPGAYIQTPSDNLLALQNGGGISILPSVQIAQTQPTAVLGTIIQQQPGAIQCGVISSEQLLLSSAPTLEMFADPTGGMFVSNQPMYYGLETIVSNTVMSSSQFMAGAVPQVLASSYQTTTQVFQASKLMEPIVDVQAMPTVTAVQPSVQNVPTVPGGYVVVNQPSVAVAAPTPLPPMEPAAGPRQINVPAEPFGSIACNVVPPSAAACQSVVAKPVIQVPDVCSSDVRLPPPHAMPAAIPRVAVRPSPVAQVNHGPWKITEPLFGGAEQPISNSVRPYFDSKHVSENTSMIKSSISSSKIPPLPNHCIAQRAMVVSSKPHHEVNSAPASSNCASANVGNHVGHPPVVGSSNAPNKISMPTSMPTSRPMNRVLPMQAVTPKQDPSKAASKDDIGMIEEPTKPVIKPAEPEIAEPKKEMIVEEIAPMKKPAEGAALTTDGSDVRLNTAETIEKVKENLKLENTSLKIVLQKQLQDGSYKITRNMKAVAQSKKTPQVTSMEILPAKQLPQIASLQLLPIKTFTLKTNKIEADKPKAKAPPVAVKKPRILAKSIRPVRSNPQNCSRGPTLMYEIKSQDGFTHTASSMAEVWETVFQAVQNARKAHNLPPLPHNPLLEGLGLENNATVYLVEQLPSVNRCTKYKPRFHTPAPPRPGDVENELPAASDNGAARAEPFKSRKVHDMFSWLASRHRQQPKMIAISEAESRRVASTNLPMAMRFRILKETSKESVGVYHSHIHGRGLFCLRDIEAGEMVIEYAGEVIRSSLTDKREKYYDSKNIGCYMFKIDDHLVVDATMKGNAARFINHSCEPNCYSRVVDILGKKHILIFALRRIIQGEELTYDYKFPFEDIKIPCTCGSRRCRKYLN